MSEAAGQLAQTLRAQLFPNVACERLKARIDRLLDFVRAEQRSFAHGPLKQALMLLVSDPGAECDGSARRSASVSLRIQLRDGAVYGLSMRLGIDNLPRYLEMAGAYLCAQPYDEHAFDDYETELAQQFDAVAADGVPCRLTLARNGCVTPYPSISAKMACKLALAALNALRAEYCLPEIGALPEAMAAHCSARCSREHPAVCAYLHSLNQDVLSFIGRDAEMHGLPLNRLKIYNFFARDADAFCRNRLQAVRVLPWLLTLLTEPMTGASDVSRIAQAIDEGVPLFDAVACILNVPRETVRWLGQRKLPSAWTLDVRRVELLLRLLSWLPQEKRPQSRQEFETMMQVGVVLLAPFRFLGEANSVPQLREARYGHCVRRWFAELIRPNLGLAHAAIEMGQLERDLTDAKDFLEAVYRSLRRFCAPAGDTGPGAPDRHLRFVLDWARSKSLRQLLALSRHWHEGIAQLPVPEAAVRLDTSFVGSDANTWPPVLAQPLRLDALTIVELTDTRSLVEEGGFMRHCVGTYSTHCSAGSSLIFSVRHADGQRLSTAELHIDPGTLRVTAGQHRAARNAAAASDCARAIETLVQLLNRPEHGAFLRTRQRFQRARQLRQERMRALACEHTENEKRAAHAAAWSLISGGIPAENGTPLAALYHATGARQLV